MLVDKLPSLAAWIVMSLVLSCGVDPRTEEAATSSSTTTTTPLRSATPAKPRVRLVDQNIDLILIDHVGVGVLRLEKRAGEWRLASANPERVADAGVVAQLLSDLERAELVQPIQERMDAKVHLQMKRGEVTVIDAWLGYRESRQRGALMRFHDSDETWFVLGVAPWIFFVTEKDFWPKSQ